MSGDLTKERAEQYDELFQALVDANGHIIEDLRTQPGITYCTATNCY